MKKIKDVNIFSKLSDDRFQKKIRRKGKEYKRFKSEKAVFGYKIIDAPDKICLYSAGTDNPATYIETIKFFRTLDKLSENCKVMINFENTRRAEAAAVVTFYAVIQAAIENNNVKFKFTFSKQNPEVNSILRNGYIFKLLNNSSEINYNFKSRNLLPVITGISNENIDNIVDHIIDYVYDGTMAPEDEWTIAVAIQEAVNNVGLHAYPQHSEPNKKWWILCQVINNQLFLAIYDTGVGIPKTITKRGFFTNRLQKYYPNAYSNLIKLLRNIEPTATSNVTSATDQLLSDAEAINLSMLPDSTSTASNKHGQGSKSIKKLVEENEDGVLWIFSNSGLYLKHQGQEQQIIDLPAPFIGTLVQWNIILK